MQRRNGMPDFRENGVIRCARLESKKSASGAVKKICAAEWSRKMSRGGVDSTPPGPVLGLMQSCQPLRKNRICYESRKGIRQYESASKKYEFTKPQKKKKKQQQKIETSLNPYSQCSACNTRGRMIIMEWIRTSATYTSAELKSARACEPPQ